MQRLIIKKGASRYGIAKRNSYQKLSKNYEETSYIDFNGLEKEASTVIVNSGSKKF